MRLIEIIKELNVEVSKPNIFQAVVAKQYDMNTRFIKATLVDGQDIIYIPAESTVKVVINAERADGLSKGFDGEVNEDGTVTVPLHSWMLEMEGTVVCDISVIDTESDDNKKLTTTAFTLLVEKATYGGDDITNDPQYDVMVRLIEDCENAHSLATEAATLSEKALTDSQQALELAEAATQKTVTLVGATTNSGGEIFNNYENNQASTNAHSEGSQTKALGANSHAEGYKTITAENDSHSEGHKVGVFGVGAHGEGYGSNDIPEDLTVDNVLSKYSASKFSAALGDGSHVEGYNNIAVGIGAHAGGRNNIATGECAYVSGKHSEAQKDSSVALGLGVIATTKGQVVMGRYNVRDNASVFIVGGGSSQADNDRKNLLAVKSDGTLRLAGLSDPANIGVSDYSVTTKAYVDAENKKNSDSLNNLIGYGTGEPTSDLECMFYIQYEE